MEKSDGALIEETLLGNLRAFDVLMERYERLVYKVALGYGGERQNAMDIQIRKGRARPDEGESLSSITERRPGGDAGSCLPALNRSERIQ